MYIKKTHGGCFDPKKARKYSLSKQIIHFLLKDGVRSKISRKNRHFLELVIEGHQEEHQHQSKEVHQTNN
jgi:hypothetical protein